MPPVERERTHGRTRGDVLQPGRKAIVGGRATKAMALQPCILHAGMPKTGSTSIQEYLAGPECDPRYLYVKLGEANGSLPLMTLLMDHPENHWVHRRRHVTSHQAQRLRLRYRKLLDRSLTTARQQGKQPILSGEGCWRLSHRSLLRLRQQLADQGFCTHVIVYLRPYLSWLESSFQELVKSGRGSFDPVSIHQSYWQDGAADARLKFAYSSRLEVFANVFGADYLTVRLLDPSLLVSGCVVADFCTTFGITPPAKVLTRKNDGLSLDALRLLYAYNRYWGKDAIPSLRVTQSIVEKLQFLPGSKLRFHASVLDPIADQLAVERDLIRQRYGLDLGESGRHLDGVDSVRSEADLLHFSPGSLEWLASTAACRPIDGSQTDAPQQVALAVDRLGGRFRGLPSRAARFLGWR
ncbi:MAG: hypothetical protein VKO00_07135 [Cyanobacteriota bacterium]|nr:hypothetical protein [Cyanobacteriota bacterium]